MDFPLGNPDSVNYAVQGTGGLDFLEESRCEGRGRSPVAAIHPGEDWNSLLGPAYDRDDPVFSIGDGVIEYAGYGGDGWGNVILIKHDAPANSPYILPDGSTRETVWSQYAHLSSISINPRATSPRPWSMGDPIGRGQHIGTVGDFPAGSGRAFHLHFEIRIKKFSALFFPCNRSVFDSDDLDFVQDKYVNPSTDPSGPGFIELNRSTTASPYGFWHVIDQGRSARYPRDVPNIFVLAPGIDPALITLPNNDNGMIPHSPGCNPSTGRGCNPIWWYGVNNHTNAPAGSALHGTFIDWVFNQTIQTPKNGGLSISRNQGRLAFEFDLSRIRDPVLSFSTWWEIESVDANAFDLMEILLVDSDGAEQHLKTLNPIADVDGPSDIPYTSGGFNVPGQWIEHNITIGPYAGQKVRIVFSFDSRDALYNGFRGWLIQSPQIRHASDVVTPWEAIEERRSRKPRD